MADFNSSLPVVGSQAITNTVPVSGLFQDVIGSVYVSNQSEAGSIAVQTISGTVEIGTDPVAVSGIVNQGTDPWVVLGSVNIDNPGDIGSLAVQTISGTVEIGTDPVAVSGIVNQGTDPWVTVGSYAITNTGSVIVTNTVSTTEGTRDAPTQDYDTAADVAAGGSDIHYYASTGSFYFEKALAAFSGKGKVVVGTGSPSVTAKAVGFNSTATPNIELNFGANPIFAGSNTYVAVVRYNRESTDAQDVYSTIVGFTN